MKRLRPRGRLASDSSLQRGLLLMIKNCLGALTLLLAAGGCRMCSSITDHSPPLAGGPYAVGRSRAGSAFGSYQSVTLPAEPDAGLDVEAPELAAPSEPPAT